MLRITWSADSQGTHHMDAIDTGQPKSREGGGHKSFWQILVQGANVGLQDQEYIEEKNS